MQVCTTLVTFLACYSCLVTVHEFEVHLLVPLQQPKQCSYASIEIACRYLTFTNMFAFTNSTANFVQSLIITVLPRTRMDAIFYSYASQPSPKTLVIHMWGPYCSAFNQKFTFILLFIQTKVIIRHKEPVVGTIIFEKGWRHIFLLKNHAIQTTYLNKCNPNKFPHFPVENYSDFPLKNCNPNATYAFVQFFR